MTIRELRKCAHGWQVALGLTEWKLTVAWGKPAADPNPARLEMSEDCEGNAWWFTEDSHALILIRRRCTEPEETLVHELLHVLIEGHRAAPARYDPLYERAINKLTAALVTKWNS